MEELHDLYIQAKIFAEKTHSMDVERLRTKINLTEDPEVFFEEYVYTVLASGFRAKVASEYTKKILLCLNFSMGVVITPLEEVFRNQRKCTAIKETFMQFSGPAGAEKYRLISHTWKKPQDLTELPMIGPTTCWQLARNIGLCSAAKPDVHMKRLFQRLFHNSDSEFILKMFQQLANTLHEPAGIVDFVVWIYLSHNGKEKDCCHGEYLLR
ncbi:Hypothetical protein GLP15_5070 [Giardia lamblia P15]|uniref:Uncharacterized protein n=1 Tax=Giardia intestinalis (strain P15) TaxID=658858 RepID=E1F7T4_GIAIA|nr:Hypothetical protein GLP15_5070 [Giardia lamblia P15]